MTIDEKLQHFYEVSIDEAKEDAAQAIQAHKENLSQMLEEHKQSQPTDCGCPDKSRGRTCPQRSKQSSFC